MRTLRRVAVLGAGTMGSRIAAHLANAGVPALLLDIVPPDASDRNAAALRGIESALKQRPGAFFAAERTALISPGNFEDDLEKVRDCDWIIEAVVEDLDVKRALWRKVEGVRAAGSVISTNTSGIPLAKITEGFPEEFRRHFLGTHFFNPPRYLHLLEMIPCAETDPEVLAFVSDFCDRRLGKGVVLCRDTPNFIANRIGSFFAATACKIMVEDGYTVEEVDALTGPLIGLPNSATFRLFDIVGLDVWAFVFRNVCQLAPDDPWRERFVPPDFLTKMIENGRLGEKSGQGFYKRVGKEKEIHAIDWKTLEYHLAQKARFPAAEQARNTEDLGSRLRALAGSGDRAGVFLWKLYRDYLLYAAGRIPEISDRIVEIDRAMRWGYAHRLGPFELWDALGFENTARRIEREGPALPPRVEAMLAAGAKSFYRAADEAGEPHTEYFDLTASIYRKIEERPGVVELAPLKRARGVVKGNAEVSLIDAGDGVLCLELHGKVNLLSDGQIEMIHAGVEEAERNFEAMIVAGGSENFCTGTSLAQSLTAAQNHSWDEIDGFIRRLQQANMALKYFARPVVAAPCGRTSGAGLELALHTARVQASAELYAGFLETTLGLIPAGGGSKELLLRLGDARKTFELIGAARVSGSAEEARSMGLLRCEDGVTMNPERVIADAKALAWSMARGYERGAPRTDIPVAGDGGEALTESGATGERESEYDLVVARKLAWVLSGGGPTGRRMLSEQDLLDLEREAFLSLCGNPKTQERIEHMLRTGKPLHN
jgi:3-hydroxyacyl-CoA dehydrogenase